MAATRFHFCPECEQPMSQSGRFPVAELSPLERREYSHNGRVAVVPKMTPAGHCEDCERMLCESEVSA